MKTLIGIVLDESSSMWSRKDEVLYGFNKFIEDQNKITDDSARLFLVKFNSNVTVIHRGVPLKEVAPITVSDYQPNGSTALYDAIRQCVQIMDEEKSADERAICVIMTDGEENCSQNTTLEEMRSIIKTHEEQDDWTFIYIGVEIAEWMKQSGMQATHCSKGFSAPRAPRRKGGGMTREQLARDNSGLDVRCLKFDVSGDDSLTEPIDSEEMNAMNNAVLDFRCSKNRRSDKPFNPSE